MKHILSDGIGTQSWTIKELAKAGLIVPMLDEAVFADTQDERLRAYLYLAERRGEFPFPISQISKGSLSEGAARVRVSKKTGKPYVRHQLPVYVVRKNGKHGMMQRHCTVDFKIEVVRRHIRIGLGAGVLSAWRKKHKEALKVFNESKKTKQPCPWNEWRELQDDALVSLWIGISCDEIDRAKDSVVPWIVNRFPLIELGFTREMCLAWLQERGIPEPPDSSCLYCPYHNDDKWIAMKRDAPEEFERAAQFEERYQESFKQCPRLDGVPYLHASRVPLREVVLVPGKASGAAQTPCKGVCGI